jgi:DNA-binding CsgD family transcriptional regulator
VLFGRERECALIDGLLGGARAGRAGALVLRGEAGVGKSALLDYAGERAEGIVVRALGVESEVELEFSALLEICRPLLGGLDELVGRQAAALRGALGLGRVEAVDPFLVGASTLSLLAAAAAGEGPLLVLVDDAQWLDRASADALVFAARRLEADGVACLFAARAGEEEGFRAAGIEAVELEGLAPEAAVEVLASASPVPVAPGVAAAVHAATRGNPLALLELPGLLTAAQLAGREPLADPLPVGAGLERAFGRRVGALPESARDALLVAAVHASEEFAPVVAALERLGVDTGWLEWAEDAGLVRIGDGRIAFRHPLVRSAVFHGAAPSKRRAAHAALARALADRGREDERAWHLAAAALGPDEKAAAALAAAGRRAREHSGYAAAAAALERAARLTPGEDARRRRLHEAAGAAWTAGISDRARGLLDEAMQGAEEPLVLAAMLHLRGQIEHLGGNVPAAIELLGNAASLAAPHDADAAVAMLSDAVEACMFGDAPGPALRHGTRARALAPQDGSMADFLAERALGAALFLCGRAVEAERRLDRALGLLDTSPRLARDPRTLTLAAIAASWLDRLEPGLAIADRAIETAGRHGAFAVLAHGLEIAAWLTIRRGRWREAYALASQGLMLARETGETTVTAYCLSHLALIDAAAGDESRCRAHAAEALELTSARGIISQWPERALALLDLGLGRLDEAARRLEAVESSIVERGYYDRGANLVEVYHRLGRAEQARAVFERYFALDAQTSFADACALAARCRGLLAGEDRFEPHFREAIDLHAGIGDAFGLARTRLCLGERLRRAGHKIDARAELRAALAAFEALGADPWAARARVEIRASGATLRRREPHEGEQLTPQELQVALQAAAGKTNKQAALALFLSPKTIDFHLRGVYRKLNVRSRAELARHFATAADSSADQR